MGSWKGGVKTMLLRMRNLQTRVTSSKGSRKQFSAFSRASAQATSGALADKVHMSAPRHCDDSPNLVNEAKQKEIKRDQRFASTSIWYTYYYHRSGLISPDIASSTPIHCYDCKWDKGVPIREMSREFSIIHPLPAHFLHHPIAHVSAQNYRA